MKSFTPRKTIFLSLFTAVALVLYIVEASLPALVPIPGIKLGLANAVTLLLIHYTTPKDAFFVLLARILLGSFFYGQAISLLYSLTGGVLCLIIMSALCKLLQHHYLMLISVVGALFHNIGQLLVALMITKTIGVLSYFPILCISGILTGLFIGCICHFIKKHGVLQPYFSKIL